jgi:hypothetical protein
MAAVDFARLRNQTMSDGQDSEVTVNTRALIDKVLARYSSEHTTLRELIQNAADAGASDVVIKYETDPSLSTPAPQTSDPSTLLKHTIQHHTLKRLVVSNNGEPFSSADWNRLKSIADGNPDETKIGAFGVGFYSVFSDCDEPFVVSGNRTMAFYWKGNTLSTKVATLPPEQATPNTIFSLEYRQANPSSPSYNPSKIPNLPGLCQFLCTSLTFVGLQKIELHLDDFRVACLSKNVSPPTEITVPPALKRRTEDRMMHVSRVTRQHYQIEAEWANVIVTVENPLARAAQIVQTEVKNAGTTLKSFFSKFSSSAVQSSKALKVPLPREQPLLDFNSENDIKGESRGIISLQTCTVEVSTHVHRNFSAEIERATKKPPARTTRVAVLTSPFENPSASLGSGSTAHLAARIFSEVLPTKAGRIFIGFPTAQTTSFLAHVFCPSLIPTVERENVDMNARYIKDWNKELLRVAGLACRICYMSDMAEIKAKTANMPVSDLVSRAVYLFQQYTATPSHPSAVLGETIEEAFWSCSTEQSIEILSDRGVLLSKSVRLTAETLSFLSGVPMVPQELANKAVTFMRTLHNRGFISDLTVSDIRNGLESKALTEDELTEFLKWCGSKLDTGEIDTGGILNLFPVTVATVGLGHEENRQGTILQIGDIRNYINSTRITPGLPFPMTTIPFKFTKTLTPKQMQMFGWTELSIVEWLQFLTAGPQLQELVTSEKLATQALGLTAKCWDQLDGASKAAVCNHLKPHAVMPTKLGMRRPEESYFHSVRLFEDLPTVKPFPGSKEKFLLALGVRKTVELPVVFDRMRTRDTTGQSETVPWSHGDLIRYFASVIDEMPAKDVERLRQTPFLPGEGSSAKQGQLFRVEDLYVPDQTVLSLGLTQVKLPFEFRPSSKEGMLLLRLGLRPYPDALTIAYKLHEAGKSNDRQLFTLAIEYFLQNYFKNNYASEAQKLGALNIAFVPVEQSPFPALVAPWQCYANEKAASLGYAVLRADLQPHADKFGVNKDPDIKDCVRKLINEPPKSKVEAEMKFSYLGSRAAQLEQYKTLMNELSSARIVPIFRTSHLDSDRGGFADRTNRQHGKGESRFHHFDAPEDVFVGRDQDYRGILDYVHYGPEATAFLLKVGAKHEPSTSDLASLLAKNPSRFLNTIGQDKYLDLLRKLAEHADALWKNKSLVREMTNSRMLLGYRDIKDESKKPIPVEEDNLEDLDAGVRREWSLNQAKDLVIVDEINLLLRFRDYIIAAPQEEILENLYQKFGVQRLSDQIQKLPRIGVLVRDQSSAQKLRKIILERVPLFLHEYERDSSSKSVRHDAKWLSAHLTVQCVSDISIRYSLADRNISIPDRRSAYLTRGSGGMQILYITLEHDTYDVSRELVQLLVNRSKRNDAIALERILTESLKRLEAKGINVERILRRKRYEAHIAKQQELEREYEERARLEDEAKTRVVEKIEPATPEKEVNMPGAFGTPEASEPVDGFSNNKGLLNNIAKKLFKTSPTPGTDGPQITRDLQATKANIENAIKDCRPTSREAVKSKHHVDATELDKGGYCDSGQEENIRKAFSIPYSGFYVDVYYGKQQTESLEDIQAQLNAFLGIIFGLTQIFGVSPGAVNIFLDKQSNTTAFNMSGSLFFNIAWFMSIHWPTYQTKEGRLRAFDSWFLTYSHELAHNLVSDHNARHNWYQQQIAIEYSQAYRAALAEFTKEL